MIALDGALELPVGVVLGTGAWSPSPVLPIVLNLLGEQDVRFRFTSALGAFRIDDVWIDPYSRAGLDPTDPRGVSPPYAPPTMDGTYDTEPSTDHRWVRAERRRASSARSSRSGSGTCADRCSTMPRASSRRAPPTASSSCAGVITWRCPRLGEAVGVEHERVAGARRVVRSVASIFSSRPTTVPIDPSSSTSPVDRSTRGRDDRRRPR